MSHLEFFLFIVIFTLMVICHSLVLSVKSYRTMLAIEKNSLNIAKRSAQI